jgi:phenylalanine-4-hydroxylase
MNHIPVLQFIVEYRQRRAVLAGFATGFRYLDPLPLITYTEEENKTWGLVYNRLQHAQSLHACAEYLSIMPLMQEHCGYGPDKIPQVSIIRFRLRVEK